MNPIRRHPSTSATIAVAVIVAIVPFDSVFEGWNWAVAVVGAAVVSAVISTTVEWQRRPWWVAVAASVVGFVIWSFISISYDHFSSGPFTIEPWRDLVDGVLDGWGSLLSDTLPLIDDRAALVFVALITWAAVAVGIHVVARTESAVGVLIAVPIVLTVGVAAALPSGLLTSVFGALTGATLLVVVAATGRAEEEGWSTGRTVMLLSFLLVAGGLAAVVGLLAEETRDPLDPRTSRETDVTSVEIPDLLQRFSTEIESTDETPVLRVEPVAGEDLPRLRLRLQVYDVYDGERWRSTTDYESLPAVPEPDLLPPGTAVSMQVSIDDLGGPWVPVPDRVIALDVPGLGWSDETQTALGNSVDDYVVTGTLVDPIGLEGTETATGEVDPRLVDLPSSTPEVLLSTAEEIIEGAPDDLGEVEALTTFVREFGRTEVGPPGHSLGRLTNDLTLAEPTGAEQLATLHALLLRAAGHPSRVVVGYVATQPDVVTTDLHVWVEVPFEGRGWVATEPAPVLSEAVNPVMEDDPLVPETTLPAGEIVEARELPRELNPDELPDRTVDESDGVDPWLVTIIAAVVLAVGAAIALIASRVNRRRARRRAVRPDHRAVGAWAELVDRLRENGQRPTASATIDDVVDLASDIDPTMGEATKELGVIAAEALHGPTFASDERAAEAWAHLSEAERALVDARGRRVVARRFTDPRVLRHKGPVPPPRQRVRRPVGAPR